MIDNKKLKLLNERCLPIVFAMALIFTMPGCGANGLLDLSKLNPNYGNRPMSPSDIQRREQAIQKQQAIQKPQSRIELEQELGKRQEAAEIENRKPIPPHPPKASNAIEAEFAASIEKYAVILYGTYMASVCGLRSNQWVTTISQGVFYAVTQEHNRDVGRSTDKQKFTTYARLAMNWSDRFTTRGVDLSKCQSLINSKEIDKLDMLQYRMTGGYH